MPLLRPSSVEPPKQPTPVKQSMQSGDDPVVESIPVFLNTTLAPYLHTVHNLSFKGDTLKCKLKKQHGWLWLEHPIDPTHPTFDKQRSVFISQQQHQQQGSLKLNKDISFEFSKCRAMVGDIHKVTDQFIMLRRPDGVHLSPLAGTLHLRPSLLPLDQASATTASVSRKPVNNNSEEAIMPHFQKRETEEQQAARLSSYDHVHKIWEEEPWSVLSYYPPECGECSRIGHRLISNPDNAEAPPMNGDIATFMRKLGIVNE